jgi:hypothetical protein
VYVTTAGLIETGNFPGKRVSYVEMLPQESVRLESDFDFWVVERMLESGEHV